MRAAGPAGTGGGNSIVRMPVAGNQMRMMFCMYMFWGM